ncbi:MAG: hypothetical protein JWR24_2502 [Actinoallomurus sp.]|nr:hypothetical protein [Actinoallomurus sp.]
MTSPSDDSKTPPAGGTEHGAETTSPTVMDLPADTDPVCVPARPSRDGDRVGVSLEFRRLDTGEMIAVAFTSPDALVAVLGEHQPWIALPTIGLRNLAEAFGVRRIEINPVLDPNVPRWSTEDLVQLEKAMNP